MFNWLVHQPWLITTGTLLAVLVIKILLVHYMPHQPWWLIRRYAQLLANKVNKASNPINQQTIAGVIATLITVLPIITMLTLFENLLVFPDLWRAFLLYLALDGVELGRQNKHVAQALVAGKNYQAKQRLQPWLLRQADNLSTTGICKAAIEMQLLRSISQLFTISILFLLFGGLTAFSFRLMLELHYCWNIKDKQFKQFGWFVKQCIELVNWLPSRLFALFLLLTHINQNIVLFSRLIAKDIFKLNSNLLLHILALLLQCKLGGVAMYNNIKLRRVAFNELGHQPEPRDIVLATNRVNQVLHFSVICIILSALIYVLLQQ